MNVSLTPELERLVDDKVKSGMYQTASEVVREGLRLLRERDEQVRLRGDVQQGLDDLERGDYTEYDANSIHLLAEEVKARGRKLLAKQRPKPTRR